ncbi:MAG TPA: hypothetical protein VLB06_05130 [Sulfuricaulis sp.]|nr:hypothetical protein [Sulfuricaulis sp.]
MKKFAVWTAVGVGLLMAASGALYFFHLSENGQRRPASGQILPSDPTDLFLAEHWIDPLPPQGAPPAQFSPIEASLAPEACGQCHVQQYRDWSDSLHSRTVGPGLLWQFLLMDQPAANGCLRCHAPLAEQKALMALERGWTGAPSAPPPSYVSANLHRQGLVCAACHVRAHRRFGPPARTPTADRLPHGGFSPNAAFEDSRFCAVCHQFPESGTRLNGKLLENTYEEWRNSLPGRAGQTCQSCHMSDRRHLWHGIHDSETTTRALTVTLDLTVLDRERMRVEAKITNTGAGHYFPTYVVPEVVFTLKLVDPAGRPKGEIARTIVARRANVDLTQELFDHRLRSGETRILGGQFRRPSGTGWSIELYMAVSPGAHYERSFQYALKQTARMTRDTRRLLREALRQVETARYRVTLARTVIH